MLQNKESKEETIPPTLRRSRRHFERSERKTCKKKEQQDQSYNQQDSASPLSWIFHRFNRSTGVKNCKEKEDDKGNHLDLNSGDTKGSSVFVFLSSGDFSAKTDSNGNPKSSNKEKKDDTERGTVLLDEMLEDLLFNIEQIKGDLKASCLMIHCKALKKWKAEGRLEDWRVILQSLQIFVGLMLREEKDNNKNKGKDQEGPQLARELPLKVEYSYSTSRSDDVIESLNQELIRGIQGVHIL